MQLCIEHTRRIKKVIIPPSKSYAQRAILAAALCETETEIINIGESQDVKDILQIAEKLGATIQTFPNSVKIHGLQNSPVYELNVGESGLGFRLTAALAAVLFEDATISGSGSLQNRSMAAFHTILPQLGLTCNLSNNHLPLRIQGKAKSGSIEIDGSDSSQYLSGLLMALPLLKGDSTIRVNQLASKPYIDITIAVLRHFNIIINQNNDIFNIPGNQSYNATKPFIVEGDYSGASIWMVHGAINEGIQIEGLNPNTVQGDKAMLTALSSANVGYEWKQDILNIRASKIKPFDFDATQCPDLFPALVVLAAAAVGTSTIQGANRLIHKESNRGTVLKHEFNKLGLKIEIDGDVMNIYGNGQLTSGTIKANNDHRIAMAGAIAGSLTPDKVCIDEIESVNKSYPTFWADFGLA